MDRGAEIGTIPEEAFSFDGYQVVRGEFFAHTFEPSITFCGSKPKQVICRVFFAKLAEMMNWDSSYRYKLMGKLISANQELLFVFDLCSSETYQRSTGADGKACAKRTPVYPAEWQNQFGLPVTEHQKQLQINIFNGFTVFGLKEDKISTSPQTPSGAEVHNP